MESSCTEYYSATNAGIKEIFYCIVGLILNKKGRREINPEFIGEQAGADGRVALSCNE